MLNIGVLNHFLQGRSKVFQNDNGRGTRVFQLVLQFSGCVERVDVHAGIAGAQDRCHGHGKLRQVGQHDGHPAAWSQAFVLQPSAQGF